MAKFIPVEPEKWAEMVKALAENARLKAEVENSKRINTELLALSNRQASDIRRLTKAGDEVLLEWSMGDENGAKNYLNALVIWNAAKDGTSDR